MPEVKVRIWSTVCFCAGQIRASRLSQIRGYLIANVPVDWDGHQNELAVKAGPEHAAEVA